MGDFETYWLMKPSGELTFRRLSAMHSLLYINKGVSYDRIALSPGYFGLLKKNIIFVEICHVGAVLVFFYGWSSYCRFLFYLASIKFVKFAHFICPTVYKFENYNSPDTINFSRYCKLHRLIKRSMYIYCSSKLLD